MTASVAPRPRRGDSAGVIHSLPRGVLKKVGVSITTARAPARMDDDLTARTSRGDTVWTAKRLIPSSS